MVSRGTEEAARARALRLLGFAADLPVHVVAVRSRLPLDRIGGLLRPSRSMKAAPLAGVGVGVILATTVDRAGFPSGVRAGIGAAEPGALALLAEVPSDAVRANADVTAIARLADSPEDLRTLEAYCATGSLRRASGRALGSELTEPAGPLRAGLALTAWRLLDD